MLPKDLNLKGALHDLFSFCVSETLNIDIKTDEFLKQYLIH